ncbi:hypothetical protein BKA67DRAFT_367030 [Truncatella angustata]|uniref:Uncharacterized protein n=1 Tax=Truncatella angustata TaxID=152316 RepID=A0A9P8ZUY0_9PEZI|nr:uncharacterized protein BKA67DRAFT_367030 [Truncatella angustata]KAH6648533.1 hypothetical protein BKA67DRAFT_367030 [Truncatella angustata]
MASIAANSATWPTPTSGSPLPINGVVNGNSGGLSAHEQNASPISQQPPPPPPALPVPSIGSASPATPLQTLPPLALQTQISTHAPPQPPLSVDGIGSPTCDHHRVLPKFTEDNSRLTHAVQQSVPEAVRRVVRDNWQKTLLGTEFHQAFVMNAVIHHANGLIFKRAIKDFGHKMVSESKHEVIEHFAAKDLDDVADIILDKASDEFLDKALEKRLGTIDARSLINALARAERLGYENSDAMDVARPDPSPTRAEPFPSASSPGLQAPYQRLAPQPVSTGSNASQERRGGLHRPIAPDLQCRLCWRKFSAPAPYEYHVKKQLCTKTPPTSAGFDFSCEHCGAGFITHVGQQYHSANKVCGHHGIAAATPKDDVITANTPVVASGRNSPAMLVSSTMQTPQRTLQVTNPVPVSTGTLPVPETAHQYNHTTAQTPRAPPPPPPPPSSAGAFSDDPYAHLTPQTRARLDDELLAAEQSYAPRFKALEAVADLKERKDKMDGLQNSFSTKQSIIRKKYGVRLRKRRTAAEIDAERIRIQQWGSTPSGKRQRIDSGAGSPAVWRVTQQQPPSPTPPASTTPPAVRVPLSNQTPVADMSSAELRDISATAATTDFTIASSENTIPRAPAPGRSLSSMQRSGYRISTHNSRHSVSAEQTPEPEEQEPPAVRSDVAIDPPTESQTPSMQPPKRNGSATEPFVLDESSSEDSDSDEDIPAHVPPSRPASN